MPLRLLSAKEIGLSFSPFVEVAFGELGEFLYSGIETDKIVSELKWEMKPLVEAGLECKFDRKYFGFGFSFAAGLPLESGKMYDSDFSLTGIKHTYSPFDEKIESDIKAKIEFYGNFSIKIIKIIPMVQILYNYISLNAFDGVCYYGQLGDGNFIPWNDENAKYYGTGKVGNINYERHSLFTFFGFNISVFDMEKISFQAGIFVSPFSYISAMDNHLHPLTKKEVYSVQAVQYRTWSVYSLNASLKFSFSKRISCFIGITGLFAERKRADSYTNNNAEKKFRHSQQDSGISASQISVKTGVLFSI